MRKAQIFILCAECDKQKEKDISLQEPKDAPFKLRRQDDASEPKIYIALSFCLHISIDPKKGAN